MKIVLEVHKMNNLTKQTQKAIPDTETKNSNVIAPFIQVNSSNLPIVNKRSLTSESSSQPDTDNCTSKTTNSDIPKQPIKKKKKN